MTTQAPAPDRSRVQMLTLDEVASRLRCSRRYVEELIRRGQIRGVRLGSKLRRVSEFDLTAFCLALPVIGAA